MILNRMMLGLSVALAFAAAGCGGDDPLTGTWTNTACFGVKATPEGIKSCSTELTFTADLAFSLKAKAFSEPATAMAPGCTTTRSVDGQTWSTDGTSFTLEGDGKATTERSSCVNATDEFKSMATTDIAVASRASGYVITDNSLTISAGDLAGTYTR
jgi:hypothetical protein